VAIREFIETKGWGEKERATKLEYRVNRWKKERRAQTSAGNGFSILNLLPHGEARLFGFFLQFSPCHKPTVRLQYARNRQHQQSDRGRFGDRRRVGCYCLD